MRSRPFCPNAWRILIPIVFLTVMSTQLAIAGRNANGALIVHTDDAVTYTITEDYCGTSFLPASCEAAITRTDKDEDTPAVIWLLAAFPDTSSPAVTTIQFGIEHNLPANEGYFETYGKCGELEMPDAGWPETGLGNLLSFGSTARMDLLFPFYWFAAYGFEEAYLGTRTYPSTDEAKFVDDGNPPQEDQIQHFGTMRWYVAGANQCPAVSGNDHGDSGNGYEDDSNTDQDMHDSIPAAIVDARPLVYVHFGTTTDSTCLATARSIEADYPIQVLATLGPDGMICLASASSMVDLSSDSRVLLATQDSIPDLPDIELIPRGTLDTRYVWNALLSEPEDTTAFYLGESDFEPTPPPIDDPDFHTTTYMMGDIGVQLIFPESRTSGQCISIPPSEDWLPGEQPNAYAGILEALLMWFQLPDMRRDIRFQFRTPLVIEVTGEPIAGDHLDETWQDEIYDYLAIEPGELAKRGFTLNTRLRKETGYDWFFHAFVVRNVCDLDGRFADGYGGFAYGHAAVLPYSASLTDWVAAHEVGHIFSASDEYNVTPFCNEASDCTSLLGYLHVPNQNCMHCLESVPCLYFGGFAERPICQWSRWRLGWQDDDTDGVFDAIDHPFSGAAMLLEAPADPLRIGEQIVLREDDGSFVKTIPVSTWNSDAGRVVWDGIDYLGNRAPSNMWYRWYRNGAEVGSVQLQDDLSVPQIHDARVIQESPGGGGEQLTFRLVDNDTHGCYVRVVTRMSGGGGQVVQQLRDEFRYDQNGAVEIEVPLDMDQNYPGVYEAELSVSDVGGGHNSKVILPFLVGIGSGADEPGGDAPLTLTGSAPNPGAEWVRWHVRSLKGGEFTGRVLGIDGRCVRELGAMSIQPGEVTVSWDCRDGYGRPAAGGKYFLALSSGGARRIIGSTVIVR